MLATRKPIKFDASSNSNPPGQRCKWYAYDLVFELVTEIVTEIVTSSQKKNVVFRPGPRWKLSDSVRKIE